MYIVGSYHFQAAVNRPSPQPHPSTAFPFGPSLSQGVPKQEGPQHKPPPQPEPNYTLSHNQGPPPRSPAIPDHVVPPRGIMTSTPTNEIQSHPGQMDRHLQNRTPPRGAESPHQPRRDGPITSPVETTMSVPHIGKR